MSSSQHKKAWVLTPNQDYTPTGVLHVGQILTNYMDPNSAVLHSGTKPIPKETLLDQTMHRGVDYTSVDTHQVAFRMWIKETLIKAVGGTVNTQSEQLRWDKYSSHSIATIMFQPSTQYAKDALALGDAPLKAKVPWYKIHRRVWMVTGLRILGEGARVAEGFIKKASGEFRVEGDGTAANVPVEGAISAKVSGAQASSHAIDDADPFVYAYRLHEIIVRRKIDDSGVGAFGGGQVYSTSDGGSDDSDEEYDQEPEVVGYEVLGLEDEPFDGEGDPMFVE